MSAAALIAICLACVQATEPPAAGAVDPAVADAMIGNLDDPRFEVRHLAAQRLRELASASGGTSPEEWSSYLRCKLLGPCSVEVRLTLGAILNRLPSVEPLPEGGASMPGLEQLAASLASDTPAERAWAEEQLSWRSRRPDQAARVMAAIRRLMANPVESEEHRQRLWSIYDRAFLTRACTDKPGWPDETVADDSIRRRIRAVASAGSAGGGDTAMQAESSQRDLLEMMVRDDLFPRVAQEINEALQEKELTDAGRRRLTALFDLTRPALAAELWSNGEIVTIQHLFVGIPQRPDGGVRDTHFDRIDDQTAHCVSGNSLIPGDYPVGVAFPHPDPLKTSPIYRLTSLPDFARRLRYLAEASDEDSIRWKRLSEQAMAAFVSRQQTLTPPQIAMLAQLEPSVVSRFAGAYLTTVEDAVDQSLIIPGTQITASRHGMVAWQLAQFGSIDAMPGLMEAERTERILIPAGDVRIRAGYLALLAIAARSPPSDANPWLAALAARHEPCLESATARADVSASAAALLLARLGRTASTFDLAETESPIPSLSVGLYHFRSEDGRRRFADWLSATAPQLIPAGSDHVLP
jgi:hypothetical protein